MITAPPDFTKYMTRKLIIVEASIWASLFKHDSMDSVSFKNIKIHAQPKKMVSRWTSQWLRWIGTLPWTSNVYDPSEFTSRKNMLSNQTHDVISFIKELANVYDTLGISKELLWCDFRVHSMPTALNHWTIWNNQHLSSQDNWKQGKQFPCTSQSK